MKKVRVITAEEAALMVKDGDTVSTGGFVSCACPEALTKALENRFVETGHPRDLTLFFAAGQGHRDGTGGDHFGHEGMCKRVVGGHWDRAAKLGELALANKLEAYNLPQGVITHMYRDIAAHNIGTITHVGLNTFVDPRHEGGKLNECTKEDLVKLVNIDGEERLLYKPIPINVCLVRGSYADEYGNCTVHREIGPLDVTAQCQATKNSGGIVIVQVEKIVQGGTLDPRLVKIPGIYVDAIVVGSPEDNNQCLGMPYDGALSGEFRIPVDDIPPIPMDAKKIIARRAAMELPQDAIVNLGTGAPEKIANVCAEEGISNKMTLTVEAGSIAGVPYGGTQFGGAANSMAILDHNVQFDFYQGGGLDVAFLGLAETAPNGDLDRSIEEYSTISAALNALKDEGKNFQGTIAADLNDKGTAEWIVISSSNVVPYEKKTSSSDSTKAGKLDVTTVEYASGAYNVTATVTKELKGVKSYTVKLTTVNGAVIAEKSADVTGTGDYAVKDTATVTLTSAQKKAEEANVEFTFFDKDGNVLASASGLFAL